MSSSTAFSSCFTKILPQMSQELIFKDLEVLATLSNGKKLSFTSEGIISVEEGGTWTRAFRGWVSYTISDDIHNLPAFINHIVTALKDCPELVKICDLAERVLPKLQILARNYDKERTKRDCVIESHSRLKSFKKQTLITLQAEQAKKKGWDHYLKETVEILNTDKTLTDVDKTLKLRKLIKPHQEAIIGSPTAAGSPISLIVSSLEAYNIDSFLAPYEMASQAFLAYSPPTAAQFMERIRSDLQRQSPPERPLALPEPISLDAGPASADNSSEYASFIFLSFSSLDSSTSTISWNDELRKRTRDVLSLLKRDQKTKIDTLSQWIGHNFQALSQCKTQEEPLASLLTHLKKSPSYAEPRNEEDCSRLLTNLALKAYDPDFESFNKTLNLPSSTIFSTRPPQKTLAELQLFAQESFKYR